MKFQVIINFRRGIMKLKKFATQIDEEVLKDLRSYADQSERSISNIVSDAVAEYIHRARCYGRGHERSR